MRRADIIRTRMAEIRTGLDEVEKIDEPTDQDATRSDDLLAEWDDLADELKPLEDRETRLKAVAERALTPSNREGGAGFGGELVTRTASDPYKDLDLLAVKRGTLPTSELRTRAAAVVEGAVKRGELSADYAEATTKLLDLGTKVGAPLAVGDNDRGGSVRGGLPAHVLLTGRDEYQDAFREFLSTGDVARAALSLTSANGGYLVPYTLDPTIILTNSGSANPWRQLAENKQTQTNDANYVTSAGVNASWLAEGTEAPDASPTVGTLKITPQKANAWVYGSYEVLEDSDFASQFPMLMSDAKDRLEEAAFATGTGSGQPKGLITAATTTVTSGTVGGYTNADIFNTQGQLPARWRGPRARLAWVGNLAQINKVRQMVPFASATSSMVDDTQYPPRLLNVPFLESTTMSAALTTGSKVLAFGDMSQFYIVDRIGMSLLYEPIVKGASQRATGQAGWFAFWRVGSDITTPAAFRILVTQ